MNTKALRQKVLDLAIHGKLVPQNPNDESAEVLLKKIREEKAKKIKKGELKADKKDSFIFVGSDKRHYEQFADGTVKDIEDEIPFDVPEGWAWCRLKEIVSINPRNKLDEDLEVSFIPMTYIDADYKNTHKQEKRIWKEIKTGFTHFAENDVAIAKISPCFENRKSVILHNLINGYGAGTTELFILRATSVISPEYLLWIVKTDAFINAGVGNFSGVVGQQRLAKDIVENYFIPLPPIEEQRRIVSSINDSFYQINQIEDNSADLQTAIKQIKSKILDLAIHGKLVPQDPNDEPAEELLKRISTSDNRPYKKFENEIPFNIPESWIWCSGNNLFNSMTSKKPEGETFRYIDIDAIDNKKHCVIQPKSIAVSEAPSRASRELKNGDVLFSLVRPYLENIALIDEQNSDCIASTGFYVCKPKTCLFPKFLFYLMTSEYVIKGLNQFMKGDNSPSISGDDIKDWLYPVPPLAEQRRIVTKIENLFNQLDSIQNELIS